MSDRDGVHVLWIDDEERLGLAGPFASEQAARIASAFFPDDAVLAQISFIDDPAPLLEKTNE